MVLVLDAFVSALVETLVILAKDEIVFLLGVRDEIDRLRMRLERILPVLADAEMRRVQDDKSINAWVKQLRDVAYDAEDIIDICKIQADKLRSYQLSSSSSSLMPVSCLFPPIYCFSHYGGVRGHQIGNKIKDINQRLDDILRDIPLLNLRSASNSPNTEMMMVSRETSPFIEQDLVGETIEEDARMLIDLLLSRDHPTNQKICVCAIVGMGGIGKTTLAQKIFNDDRFRAEFLHIPPMWVHVSRDFSDIDLLKVVIKRAGGNPGEDKIDLELLLNEIIKGKRLFLVLDDVWNPRVCEGLVNRLSRSCLGGSSILVTTRNVSVATSMGAIRSHHVQKLSDEDGWSLLSKMVFLDDEDPIVAQNTLKDIGMRIVNKCDGLPLAVKTIAGLLRSKEKMPSDWEKVLGNPAWALSELPEGVMGALYLSYTELPSNLKQTFLYFALFPEGYEYQRVILSSLWIAEGFVEAKGNMLLEEVAVEYWKELVHRNLLQPITRWYGSTRCKIHEVLHSLARHLASHECFCKDMQKFNERSTSLSLPMMVRRAHITNNTEAIPNVVLDHGSLRTLRLHTLTNLGKLPFTKLKFLRILNIQDSSIDKLPNSIGELTQLKFLNVSWTGIRELPKTIGNLKNLQFLIMACCKNLRTLPNSITNLCNLRNLSLQETVLQNMPFGIGKLTDLVQLHGLMLSDSNINEGKQERYSNIEEVGFLTQLMSLSVYKLENASGKEARAATLKAKPHLTVLSLSWTSYSLDVEPHTYHTEEEIEIGGEVLEELCPPPCLDLFYIEGYFGLKYPSWMMETSTSFLPNLRILSLKNCVLCEKLPPLGLLPQLRILEIDGASAVINIGPELFGLSNRKAIDGGGTPVDPHCCFRKLEILNFKNMPNWEEWSWLREEMDMKDPMPPKFLPCLRLIHLVGCPKLQFLPEGLFRHAIALKTLIIKGAHSLQQVENFPHLQELTFEDCPCIEMLANLPALRNLWIDNCGELKRVEGLGALQTLFLGDPELCFLPEWLVAEQGEESQFPMLRMLNLIGSNQLLSRCLVGRPDWDKIRQIPRVNVKTCYLPASYINYTKFPFSFDTNLANHSDTVNNGEGSSSARS